MTHRPKIAAENVGPAFDDSQNLTVGLERRNIAGRFAQHNRTDGQYRTLNPQWTYNALTGKVKSSYGVWHLMSGYASSGDLDYVPGELGVWRMA